MGIICEYDPFHRGHRRQFELIRAQLPGARIVCLMSGPFTQRGMPALHSPADRARAALEGGCDLVLELPCAFSVRDAEHFALGGVSILTRLGFVTHLSFGAEDGLDALLPAAALLDAPTPAFQEALRAALVRGASFAAAQGEALAACLPAPRPAPTCRPDALDSVLLYKLRTQSAQALARLPDCTEGLENRLKACAAHAATRDELLSLLKTRRYAHARLSRLCCHALLDITGDLLSAYPLPTYARLLGIRRGALSGELRRSALSLPARAADLNPYDPLAALDLRAYDLWALGAGLAQGMMQRQKVCAL